MTRLSFISMNILTQVQKLGQHRGTSELKYIHFTVKKILYEIRFKPVEDDLSYSPDSEIVEISL
jgi:hypothetical protein